MSKLKTCFIIMGLRTKTIIRVYADLKEAEKHIEEIGQPANYKIIECEFVE